MRYGGGDIPYVLATAFSNTTSGGNPAVTFFPGSPLPENVYKEAAAKFNQPIAVFIWPSGNDGHEPDTREYHIRYYSEGGKEIALCGHGTLAAAKAAADNLGLECPKKFRFHTRTMGPLDSRALRDGGWEIDLPVTTTTEVLQEERERLIPIFEKAFGKSLHVGYIGRGGPGFGYFVMVVLDETDLAGCQVDARPLLESGYTAHTFTASSSKPGELFISRMFAPAILASGEDHVCGSAHCLMGPYWYREKGIPFGEVAIAKQASKRGGTLRLVVQEDGIGIGGSITLLGRGNYNVVV